MDKTQMREEYRNLSEVEHAFWDLKSDNIQNPPEYHRNENQTRGHVLVSMFAYAIIKEMKNKIFPFLKLYNKKHKSQLAFADIKQELNDIKLCQLEVPETVEKIILTELNELQSETLKPFGLSKKQPDLMV